MKSKLECSFCYTTNTKWVEKSERTGLFSSRSIGKVEEIDSSAITFKRCVSCGEIVCGNCLHNMGSNKGFIFKSDVCPKCSSKMIKIN